MKGREEKGEKEKMKRQNSVDVEDLEKLSFGREESKEKRRREEEKQKKRNPFLFKKNPFQFESIQEENKLTAPPLSNSHSLSPLHNLEAKFSNLSTNFQQDEREDKTGLMLKIEYPHFHKTKNNKQEKSKEKSWKENKENENLLKEKNCVGNKLERGEEMERNETIEEMERNGLEFGDEMCYLFKQLSPDSFNSGSNNGGALPYIF